MSKCVYCNSKGHYFAKDGYNSFRVQGCARYAIVKLRDSIAGLKPSDKAVLTELARGNTEIQLDGVFTAIENNHDE